MHFNNFSFLISTWSYRCWPAQKNCGDLGCRMPEVCTFSTVFNYAYSLCAGKCANTVFVYMHYSNMSCWFHTTLPPPTATHLFAYRAEKWTPVSRGVKSLYFHSVVTDLPVYTLTMANYGTNMFWHFFIWGHVGQRVWHWLHYTDFRSLWHLRAAFLRSYLSICIASKRTLELQLKFTKGHNKATVL